jgi:F-type H+-transporting ATPase subunit b
MGHILSQLGHLFVQAIPTAALVFILMFVLDRLFFRRLMEVLNEREARTSGAVARAREQAALAETRSREYEAAFQAVRQEVYRQRENERKRALAEREEALQKARLEAEAHLAKARADLAAEVGKAKAELNITCQALAGEIATSLVGDGSSTESGRVN